MNARDTRGGAKSTEGDAEASPVEMVSIPRSQIEAVVALAREASGLLNQGLPEDVNPEARGRHVTASKAIREMTGILSGWMR